MIGVYDSGLGGLSVWRHVRSALPHESITYLGDGLNCPYGSKSAEQIRALAEKAVGELIDRGASLVVVACNTATAAAIEHLRKTYKDIPIVGMEPAVKPAAAHTRTGTVAVLATERSLEGDLFRRTAAHYGAEAGVRVLPAVGRGFVELVENGLSETPAAYAAVRAVVEPLVAAGADQIVLGCTHYPFLLGALRKALPAGVEIVDPGPAVARRVVQLLDEHGLRRPSAVPSLEFITFADEEYARRLRERAME